MTDNVCLHIVCNVIRNAEFNIRFEFGVHKFSRYCCFWYKRLVSAINGLKDAGMQNHKVRFGKRALQTGIKFPCMCVCNAGIVETGRAVLWEYHIQ